MRKFVMTAVLVAACAPVMTLAADANKEEQCQKEVTSKLEALQAASEKEGKEIKLKDLSMLDIMNLAKANGACAAQAEIVRREK